MRGTRRIDKFTQMRAMRGQGLALVMLFSSSATVAWLFATVTSGRRAAEIATAPLPETATRAPETTHSRQERRAAPRPIGAWGAERTARRICLVAQTIG